MRNECLRLSVVFLFAGQDTSLSLEGSRRGLGWRGGKDKGKDKSKAGRSGLAREESRASSKHQAASRGQARIVSLPPLRVCFLLGNLRRSAEQTVPLECTVPMTHVVVWSRTSFESWDLAADASPGLRAGWGQRAGTRQILALSNFRSARKSFRSHAQVAEPDTGFGGESRWVLFALLMSSICISYVRSSVLPVI